MGSCDDSDVIIAGGGPVGLLLACELRLAEVGVVVLERTPDGATLAGWFGQPKCPRPSDPASMGFNDASHFSKTFKRAFGVTPTSIMPTARR